MSIVPLCLLSASDLALLGNNLPGAAPPGILPPGRPGARADPRLRTRRQRRPAPTADAGALQSDRLAFRVPPAAPPVAPHTAPPSA